MTYTTPKQGKLIYQLRETIIPGIHTYIADTLKRGPAN